MNTLTRFTHRRHTAIDRGGWWDIYDVSGPVDIYVGSTQGSRADARAHIDARIRDEAALAGGAGA